jgi:hypothetical protein
MGVANSIISTNFVIAGGAVSVENDAVIFEVLKSLTFTAFDVTFSRPNTKFKLVSFSDQYLRLCEAVLI